MSWVGSLQWLGPSKGQIQPGREAGRSTSDITVEEERGPQGKEEKGRAKTFL